MRTVALKYNYLTVLYNRLHNRIDSFIMINLYEHTMKQFAMKKTRITLLSATAMMGYFIVTGWSTGPAHSGSLMNGTPGVSGSCNNCHAGGSGTTTIQSVDFKDDATGIMVTDNKYKPGHTYTVTIHAGGSGNQGFYGFQANFRRGSNSNAGSLSATQPGMAVATASGYSVIEHTSRLTAMAPGHYMPSFKWTAPAAGAGTVTLHAILNAVDGNSSVSGDMPSAPFAKTLAEASTTAVATLNGVALAIFPNPVSNQLYVRLQEPATVSLAIFDAGGKAVAHQEIVNAKETVLSINQLPAGTYYLRYTDGAVRGSMPFTKY